MRMTWVGPMLMPVLASKVGKSVFSSACEMGQDGRLEMRKGRTGGFDIVLGHGLLGLGKQIIAMAVIVGHESSDGGHGSLLALG